jgi:thiol-disulfide isomerase/thioredoxin
MKTAFVLAFIISLSLKSYSQQIHLSNVRLKTINDKTLYLNKEHKLKLFVFLSPECPLSQKYTLTLNRLYKQYNQLTDFIGIFPGRGYSNTDYKAFKKKYDIQFELAKDEKLKLVSLLHASKTPEAFLLNSSGKILYYGAIDDWAIDLGRNKPHPVKHYLQDAILSSSNGWVVSPKFVEAIGCFIEK